MDSSSYTRINTDALQDLVNEMNSLSSYMNSLKESDISYASTVQDNMFKTQRIIKQIEKLYNFDSSAANIYESAFDILNNVKQGLLMISMGTFNDINCGFTYKLSDLDWAKNINGILAKSDEKATEEINAISDKIPNITEEDMDRVLELAESNPEVKIPQNILDYINIERKKDGQVNCSSFFFLFKY